MAGSVPASPLRYDPSVEAPEADEAETAAAIVAAMREISQTALEEYGRAVRSVHAKSQGLLRGERKVLDGLPPASAQGVFAQPGARPVLLRFSPNPGDILDDNVSTPRGLGI